MAWYDDLLKQVEGLWEKKVEKTDFSAIFRRLDVDQFFNNLSNLWSPNELIRKIGGHSKLSTLYKDHDIYAAVDKRVAALLMSRMTFEGPNAELIKWFEDQLKPHERQLKQDFWWTIYNGWGVEQIIYDEDLSGKIKGFQREEFWRFEPQRDLIHVKLINTSNDEFRNKILPYGKWVLTTNNGTASNPYGDPMAERLIMPWIFKCQGWDLWIDFAKRFANGFMHARIADMKQKREVRESLERAGKASVLVTDKNSDLTMIQASRDSSLYQALDERTVRAIQKVILGETQTSDMAERGSSGSAGVQNEVRQEKTWADIDLVERAINEVIYQIGMVNGFSEDQLPKVTLSWDPDFSLEQSARDQVLYGMGIRFEKKYFQKTYGLADDDFSLVDPAASTPSPFGFTRKGKSTFLSPLDMKKFIGAPDKCAHLLDANSSRKSSKQQDEKEGIVGVLSRNSSPPLDAEDLISAILTSQNEKELDEKLNALFDTRNNSFVDDMTKGLYYAAALGARLGNPETVKDDEEK